MRRILAALALMSLPACATAPPGPEAELALARQVFEASGGFEEARLIARLGAPFALAEIDDVGERCRSSLSSSGAGVFAGLACDLAVGALQAAQSGRADLTRGLEGELRKLEARAPQALADTYTYAELRALRDFYRSPEGRGIAAKRAEYWSRLAGR